MRTWPICKMAHCNGLNREKALFLQFSLLSTCVCSMIFSDFKLKRAFSYCFWCFSRVYALLQLVSPRILVFARQMSWGSYMGKPAKCALAKRSFRGKKTYWLAYWYRIYSDLKALKFSRTSLCLPPYGNITTKWRCNATGGYCKCTAINFQCWIIRNSGTKSI